MQKDARSILVVDSSASHVFYTAMVLKKLQYGVQTASSAEDALRLIANQAPSAVITDTVLPRMSGVDLLKQIKNSSSLSFIPVIMHTAEASTTVKDACMAAGCTGYFLKPVHPDALYRAIQAATEATPRKNIRISVSLKVRFADPSPGSAVRTEEVTALSEGGLYVKTTSPAAVKQTVPLTLLIRDREIKVSAVVLYSSATAGGPDAVPGMGMQFQNIGPDDLAFVREFIREHVMSSLAKNR